MAINQNDDYEKLAKLLYPSIEASGNVYYGQTRKLTMDEVLKKNDLGFESYVIPGEDIGGHRYGQYFCWKLGPLHDKFETKIDHVNGMLVMGKANDHKVQTNGFDDTVYIIDDTEYDQLLFNDITVDDALYGSFFIKYRVIVNSNTVDNVVSSGDFKSYENSISLNVDDIVCTYYTSPIDGSPINDRNFLFDPKDNFLYIRVYNSIESVEESLPTPLYTEEELAEPLTIKVISGSFTLGLWSNSPDELYYKKNSDENYTLVDSTAYIELATNDIVLLTGKIIGTGNDHFTIRSDYNSDNDILVEIRGNINSLINKDEYTNIQVIEKDNAFKGLFKNMPNKIKLDCTNLILPATSLGGNYCYKYMFQLTGIVHAPKYLPAERLSQYCYEGMFTNCEYLVNLPKLPYIENLESYSFKSMFAGCTRLKKPYKEIKFTSTPSIDGSFHGMFSGCTSLKTATNLPSEPIGHRLYEYMFTNCTSLKTGSILPIEHSDEADCPCLGMFIGCTSINWLACNADSSFDVTGGDAWLPGEAESGTFYKNDNNSSWRNSASGIPSGWEVKNWSELPAEPTSYFNVQYTGDEKSAVKSLCVTGIESDKNGRGHLLDNNIYSMKGTFDEDNTHLMNTINTYDGSYNQEVWGYKTFNSPIKFRNGVYGETASLIATTSDAGENVTRLSLYDCTLNGNDASLVNNPYIQLGYTVDSESNKSESVIELKANKIVIDGTLETSGSSGGLIPFIPATKGPDDLISDPTTSPAIGEIIRITAQYIQVSSDERWSDDGNWVYVGFPKQNINVSQDYSNNGQYKIYYNENNDHRVQYARYDVESAPGNGNVYYSDTIDGNYMSWELALPQGSEGPYTVRFGNWVYCGTVAEYTEMASPEGEPYIKEYSVTVYENEWAYTAYRYYGDGSMGSISGQGYDYKDHIADYGTPPNQTPFLAGTYYTTSVEEYEYNNDLQFVVGGGTGNWIEILPTNSITYTYHNVYYNNSNGKWKIYNETTHCYINALGCDDFDSVVNGGVDEDEFRDENDNIVLIDDSDNEHPRYDTPFDANNSNWKHFGIFRNPGNSSNNRYCFNGKINGITVEYINGDNDNADIYMYNSTSEVSTSELNENTNEEAIESFGNQFVPSEPSQSLAVKNIHYGTVLTYSHNSRAWKLGSYNVKLYILPLKYYTVPNYEVLYLPQYYSTIDGAQIVALTSARTNTSGSINNPSEFFEGENMFYAQRIK